MKIILFDKSTVLCNALQDAFRDITDIQVINCELKDLPEVDYVTAPGNSFAMMTGGLDYHIREILGFAAQDALQDVILKNYPYGIPIGDYIVLEGCGATSFNNILYMPSMRTPQKIRPYDASFVMSIIVDFALAGPEQLSIAIPGIGTGCGTLEPRIASIAMRAGYDTALTMRRHGYV